MRFHTIYRTNDYGDSRPITCVELDEVLAAVDNTNLLFDNFVQKEMENHGNGEVRNLYHRIQFGIRNYAKNEIKKAIIGATND